MRKWSAVLAVAAAWASGCAGPEVTVRHVLPADLPVGREATVFVAPFKAVSGDRTYADFAASELAGRLETSPSHRPVRSREDAGLVVSADVRVRTDEDKGTRSIRRLDPAERKAERIDVATVVRTASVRVDFVVTDAKTGRRVAGAETRERYDSRDDPRARGGLGLDRPDNKAFLPELDTVVRELLIACVDTFCRMIRPREVAATVTLRHAAGEEAAKGLAAAGKGDFADAAEHLAVAAARQPKSNELKFDLAVCLEAAGRLREALTHYEAVLEADAKGYPQAAAGAARLRKVLPRMK